MAEWNPHRDRARTECSTPCRTTHTQTHVCERTHAHTRTHMDTLISRFLLLHSVTVPPEEWSSLAPGTTTEWACSLFATVMALFPQLKHVKGDIMHMGFTLTDQYHWVLVFRRPWGLLVYWQRWTLWGFATLPKVSVCNNYFLCFFSSLVPR